MPLLSGVVSSTTGCSVAGLLVEVRNYNTNTIVTTTTTGPTGAWSVNVPAGHVVVRCPATGICACRCPTGELEYDVNVGTEPLGGLDFVAVRVATLAGIVTASGGCPVAGLTVEARDAVTNALVDSTTTDALGNWSMMIPTGTHVTIKCLSSGACACNCPTGLQAWDVTAGTQNQSGLDFVNSTTTGFSLITLCGGGSASAGGGTLIETPNVAGAGISATGALNRTIAVDRAALIATTPTSSLEAGVGVAGLRVKVDGATIVRLADGSLSATPSVATHVGEQSTTVTQAGTVYTYRSKLEPTGTPADRLRIQTVLDDHGWVDLAQGSWIMDGVSLAPRYQDRIVGSGSGTVLHPGVGQANPVIDVREQQWEVQLADFSIEGYTANGGFSTTAEGIRMDVGTNPRQYPDMHGDNGLVVDNVRINYLNADAITLIDASGQGYAAGSRFTGVNVYQCTGRGFVLNGITDSNFSDCIVADCGKNGFDLIASANNRWSGCKAYFSGDPAQPADLLNLSATGWRLRYVHRDMFTNCESQDSMHHGWYFETVGNVRLVDCLSDSGNWNDALNDPNGTAGFYVNAAMLDGALDLIVQGDNFRNPPVQDFHIFVTAATTKLHGRLMSGTLSAFPGAAAIGGPGAASVAYNAATGKGILVL